MSQLTNPTIEKMRGEEVGTADRLTIEQVRTIVDGLLEGLSLSTLADTGGMDEALILEIVAEFGTWLTHVRGGAKVDIVQWFETGTLFPLNDLDDTVVIPAGFERTAPHKRDVAKSLAAIVVTRPDDEMIARWLDRKYPSDTAVLTYPMVSTVWKFSELDRLSEIDEVSPNPAFRKLVVDAYDMLSLAVSEANGATRTLAKLSTADDDEIIASLDELRDATVKLGWLQPREMEQLRRRIDIAVEEPSAAKAVRSRLGTLRRLMVEDPTAWYIESVGKLNQGHIQQIAHRSGIAVEGVSRADEAEIRRRLSDLGMKADADRLVPEGVRAALSGVAEEFWAAMEARAEGDPQWREMLEDAYASAQ